MAEISMQISFPGRMDFTFDLTQIDEGTLGIPEWAYFKHYPCPGSDRHDKKTNYCALACRINSIIDYFNDVDYMESGSLVITEGKLRETKIFGDAQTIFFHAFWAILNKTPCPSLNYGKNLFKNYAISPDINSIFYLLFSTFLVENYLTDPSQKVSLEQFEKMLQDFIDILLNLLVRMRDKTETSFNAPRNGLIVFENLVEYVKLDFRNMLEQMKNKSF